MALTIMTIMAIAIPAFAATSKTTYVDTSSTNSGTLNLRKTKSSSATVLKKISNGIDRQL